MTNIERIAKVLYNHCEEINDHNCDDYLDDGSCSECTFYRPERIIEWLKEVVREHDKL